MITYVDAGAVEALVDALRESSTQMTTARELFRGFAEAGDGWAISIVNRLDAVCEVNRAVISRASSKGGV